MEDSILKYKNNISQVKEQSLSQIKILQGFIEEQLNNLSQKISQKIEKHNQQIENNINYYNQISNGNPLKGYFENMLQSQLVQEIKVFEIEDNESIMDLNNNEQDNQQQAATHQQKQLKEVYSILKKAINLFSEQYSNSISSLHTNITSFQDKNIDFQSDFYFSEDRKHANIIKQSSLQQSQKINNNFNNSMIDEQEIQNNNKSNNKININFDRMIDLQKISPSHLPPQYQFNRVKCFSILEDNRRAVLCTFNHLILIDLLKSKIIKYTEVRGPIPTLPSCIQPLYSYEYDYSDIGSGEYNKESIHAKILANDTIDFSDHLFSINSNSNNSNVINNQEIKNDQIQFNNNFQNNKRQRRQNLVAVGFGNTSYTIEICIFNINTLQKIIRLPGHQRQILKLIQPPLSYNTLFSISQDKKIFVWDISQANPILIENTGHVQSLTDAFMINDKQLSTFSLNGEVFIWDIEYSIDQPYKFKNIKKTMIIQRSCLSLFIGQIVTLCENHFFSITSLGTDIQKYYLEMNDYSNRIIFKYELPCQVAGLNILCVNQKIYAIITYYSQNYFEIYSIQNIYNKSKSVELYSRILFNYGDQINQSIMESPRVQFIQTNEDNNENSIVQIALALDQNIHLYSVNFQDN